MNLPFSWTYLARLITTYVSKIVMVAYEFIATIIFKWFQWGGLNSDVCTVMICAHAHVQIMITDMHCEHFGIFMWIQLGSIRKSVFIPKKPPISDNGKIINNH